MSELDVANKKHSPAASKFRGNNYGPTQISDGNVHLGNVYNHQCYRIERLCLCGTHQVQKLEQLPASSMIRHDPHLHAAVARNILSRMIDRILDETKCSPWRAPPFRRLVFDHLLSQTINQWLSSSARRLLYLQYLSGNEAKEVDVAVALQTVDAVKVAKYPAFAHIQAFEDPSLDDTKFSSAQGVMYMMLNISARILDLLPEGLELMSDEWSVLDDPSYSHQLSFAQCCNIFGASLRVAPRDLHIVVTGHPAFFDIAGESTGKILSTFIGILRQAIDSESRGIKALIVTQHGMPTLVDCLDEMEMMTILSSAKTKTPQAPIVMRREKSPG